MYTDMTQRTDCPGFGGMKEWRKLSRGVGAPTSGLIIPKLVIRALRTAHTMLQKSVERDALSFVRANEPSLELNTQLLHSQISPALVELHSDFPVWY